MRTKHFLTLAMAIMLVAAFTSQSAYADSVFSLRYRLTDSNGQTGNWIVVDDNSLNDWAYDDNDNPINGTILISANTDIWRVVIEAGQGGRNANNPDFPLPNLNLDLSSNVTVADGGVGSLEVQLSQSWLTPAAPGWDLNWAPIVSGSGLSANVYAYADNSNHLFGDGASSSDIQSIASFGLASTTDPYSHTGMVSVGVPYSLTMGVVFNATGTYGAHGGGDALLVPTPEPGTLLMLGAGLLLLGMMGLRSKQYGSVRGN